MTFSLVVLVLINFSLMEGICRIRCSAVKVGAVCTLEESLGNFKRVQIINLEKKEKTRFDASMYADVRCIDTGIVIEGINTRELLWIPEELLKIPTHVMEVFLVGIAPYDNEYCWNHDTIEIVHKWFADNCQERSYVIGTVHLHLSNTIWIDTLEIGTELIGHPDVIGLSLKTQLIRENYAVINEEHLDQLYNLCRSAGMREINGNSVQNLLNDKSNEKYTYET